MRHAPCSGDVRKQRERVCTPCDWQRVACWSCVPSLRPSLAAKSVRALPSCRGIQLRGRTRRPGWRAGRAWRAAARLRGRARRATGRRRRRTAARRRGRARRATGRRRRRTAARRRGRARRATGQRRRGVAATFRRHRRTRQATWSQRTGRTRGCHSSLHWGNRSRGSRRSAICRRRRARRAIRWRGWPRRPARSHGWPRRPGLLRRCRRW
jgi:hypothetical protein